MDPDSSGRQITYRATYEIARNNSNQTNSINQCHLVAPISSHLIKQLSIHRDMHLTLILIHFHPCYHDLVIAHFCGKRSHLLFLLFCFGERGSFPFPFFFFSFFLMIAKVSTPDMQELRKDIYFSFTKLL